MSTAEDMLAKAEADLSAFINRPQYGGREFARIVADLRKWRQLNDRVAYWQGKVKAERHRAAKPEREHITPPLPTEEGATIVVSKDGHRLPFILLTREGGRWVNRYGDECHVDGITAWAPVTIGETVVVP